MTYRRGQFWQPDVTVATLVVREGRLLMVEEEVRGRRVLNQPAGHLEPDESLFEAALRETLEETGWRVRLTGFVGAYQWKSPDQSSGGGGRHYLRFAFAVAASDPVDARFRTHLDDAAAFAVRAQDHGRLHDHVQGERRHDEHIPVFPVEQPPPRGGRVGRSIHKSSHGDRRTARACSSLYGPCL